MVDKEHNIRQSEDCFSDFGYPVDHFGHARFSRFLLLLVIARIPDIGQKLDEPPRLLLNCAGILKDLIEVT